MPPASQAPFMAVLASFVTGGKPIVPSMEAPLTESLDNDARLRASLQSRLLKTLPVAALTAHPAAASFPGRVPAQSKPVVKVVRIDPAIPAWHSTGLFADAGAPITVKLPAEAIAAGYQVRIGCHTDGIYATRNGPGFRRSAGSFHCATRRRPPIAPLADSFISLSRIPRRGKSRSMRRSPAPLKRPILCSARRPTRSGKKSRSGPRPGPNLRAGP